MKLGPILELSKETLARYAGEASSSMFSKGHDAGALLGRDPKHTDITKGRKKIYRDASRRLKYIDKAINKIKEENLSEAPQNPDYLVRISYDDRSGRGRASTRVKIRSARSGQHAKELFYKEHGWKFRNARAHRADMVKEEELSEAKRHDELRDKIVSHMRHRYAEVHYDLPRDGNYHYHSAHDHLTDDAYDHFNKHPDFDRKHHNLRSLATRALRGYANNDTAESRRNERKRYAVKKKPVEKKKPSEPSFRIKRVRIRPHGPYLLKKIYKEETELQELSKSTLGKYFSRTVLSYDSSSKKKNRERGAQMAIKKLVEPRDRPDR